MDKSSIFKLSFWKVVGIVIVVSGLYATYLRFTEGLGAVTNLSDSFPWGLWIGFDILCGVGLAAGGFTICAVTHIFNIEKFKPLTRPAILTAFLGYLLVVFALLIDLGRPYYIWHAIIMWNPHSVMFEVAWCVMLYSTVLFLEFAPVVLERFKMNKLLMVLRRVLVPIMILGILLSTLHQSSLGSLYLIIPSKMHPLWYTALLPVNFYISAIATGFAMVIFEAYLSARAFGHGIKLELLSKIAVVSLFALLLNIIIKIVDLTFSGKLHYLTVFSTEVILYWSELILGTVVPVILLANKKFRESRLWLYISSIFIIAGFLMNRLNVSVTSITAQTGFQYFPSIHEILITSMIVVLGMWAFKLIIKNFPVFQEDEESAVEKKYFLKGNEIIVSE